MSRNMPLVLIHSLAMLQCVLSNTFVSLLYMSSLGGEDLQQGNGRWKMGGWTLPKIYQHEFCLFL